MPDETRPAPRVGRPKKNPKKLRDVRIMVNLTHADAAEVKKVAKNGGLSRSQWLRELVRWATKEEWQPQEAPVEAPV